MAFSVGLTLYNLGARRLPRLLPGPAAPAVRPPGPLIWLHAPSGDSLPGMAELGRHLTEEDGLAVLLTGPQGAGDGAGDGGAVHSPPPDTPAEARDFLAFWLPDLALFAGGEVRPALLAEAAARKLPCLMVEARAPHLMAGRDGWYPGLMRRALASLAGVHLADAGAGRAFRKAGLDPQRMQATGRLEQPALSLPYLEAERAALAGLLAGRPVWLAMAVPQAEESAVIAAHRHALALSHRLLLILVPQDPARAEALARRMEADDGWHVARRSAEQEPDPQVEVFIPDQPGEAGLWYRLAPVTYLGGSLAGTGCIADPMEPASTGSAILFGPRTGAHAGAYARLGSALAARMVASAPDLALALADLLSPDRAARQAHAAWEVVSDGAEVTQALLTDVRRLLDRSR